MGKVSNPYNFNIKQNYISYAELGKELVDLSYYCKNNIEEYYQITELPQEHIEYLNSVRPNNIESLFNYCSKLISLDLSNFDTSQVTNMRRTFKNCSRLQTLDLSNWDTSKVTNMNEMFSGCEDIKTLDLSNFNTSNVTDMSEMFSRSGSISIRKTLDLSNFNTSNVTDMSNMFDMCADKIIGLSNWNTSKVIDMSYMFSNYENTIHISDLSNWDVSNVTDMGNMFYGCNIEEDELDLSNWDTSKVTDMGSMFAHSSGFYYIKDAIDMSSVRSCYYMFYKSSLKSVHLKNVPRSLDLSNIGDVSYIVDNYID